MEALPNIGWGEPRSLETKSSLHAENELSALRAQAKELRRARAAQTDQSLFEQIARDRSEDALSELYDRFSPRIYALLLHILRVEEEAQDLLQEIFIIVWNKAPVIIDSNGNLAGWIMSLARNRAVDELRSKRYRSMKLEDSIDVGPDRPDLAELVDEYYTTDGELTAKEAQEDVRIALRSLSDIQRSVVDLAYFGGLTHSEISTTLRVPMGSVKSYLRQSFIKMADALKPRVYSLNNSSQISNPKV